MKQKELRAWNRTAQERKMPPHPPATDGEARRAEFFFISRERPYCIRVCLKINSFLSICRKLTK